ncbi:hypothetical protein [Mesorhizobium sp.]|uniref:hypothetical protein n=1 Tax=Mesorhizobium sp. TaxID=1871066 RepID=UPI0025BF4BBA|nr:hypothetical protein [Mesorhizobium sp.]
MPIRPVHHGRNGYSMLLIFQHFSFNIKFLQPAECRRIYAKIRPFSPRFDLSVHTERTRKMATFTKLSSGSWRVQVRRKGRYVSETFLRRDDARRWATETERQVDRGETPTKSRVARLKTFGELIDLHIDDMCDVGKSPRRSKAAALDMLQRHLGKCNIAALDRERLILFGRERAAQGAGPMTLGIDIGFIEPSCLMLRPSAYRSKSSRLIWRVLP